MGLCSSKNNLSLNPRYPTKNRFEDQNVMRTSVFNDTDHLIPSNISNYNNYLVNDNTNQEMKHEYRVKELNEKLTVIRKGYLNINKYELTFAYNPNKSNIIVSWNFTTLRWYAYSRKLLVFQCGRKASTGEGTFIFSCHEYRKLKESFEQMINERYTSGSTRNLLRYAKLPGCSSQMNFDSNCQMPLSSTLNNKSISRHSSHNYEIFKRSQSINASCFHSSLLPCNNVSIGANNIQIRDNNTNHTLSPNTPNCEQKNAPTNPVVAPQTPTQHICSDETFSSSTSTTYPYDSSEMTSSDSNLSHARSTNHVSVTNNINGTDQSNSTVQQAPNYINGVGLPLEDGAPEYLVAAAIQIWHGYVNQDSTAINTNSNNNIQGGPNYLNYPITQTYNGLSSTS